MTSEQAADLGLQGEPGDENKKTNSTERLTLVSRHNYNHVPEN